MENEKILDIIMGEYVSELFEDHRKDYNIMKHNFPGPPTMKDEIRQNNWPIQYISGDFKST